MKIDLRLGDCIEVLKTFQENSVDSIVTDSPYGLSFMGKKWDYDVPSVDIWRECLRVLKPGGHLLSFAGSRTYHRMAVRIEDAGFEIRDQIMWVYASGFPKSLNIGKAIDKKEGNEREIVSVKPNHKKGMDFRYENDNSGWLTNDEIIETKGNSQWEGWGTALKPAHEPIVMARKPLSEKSIAENVLKHGTGGINIDGSRIEMKDKDNINFDRPRVRKKKEWVYDLGITWEDPNVKEYNEAGRWPANIIFDEEAGKLLDEQSGTSKSGKPKGKGSKSGGIWQPSTGLPAGPEYGDIGGASRFFYCPKTSKKDRNEGLDGFQEKTTRRDDGQPYGMNTNQFRPDGTERKPVQPKANHHPTVKPTDLMRYLINLVTPKGGTTLDPFMGSGSTGKAAVRCGVNFIGIEKEEEYMKIAEARINHEKNKTKQLNLFDGEN